MAGLLVGHGGEASQALLIHEDPQRVTGCDEDVDPHVKLKAIDEEGLEGQRESGGQGASEAAAHMCIQGGVQGCP